MGCKAWCHVGSFSKTTSSATAASSKPQPQHTQAPTCWSTCSSVSHCLSPCTSIFVGADHPTHDCNDGFNVVPGVSLDSVRWRAAHAECACRTLYRRAEFPVIAELVEQM